MNLDKMKRKLKILRVISVLMPAVALFCLVNSATTFETNRSGFSGTPVTCCCNFTIRGRDAESRLEELGKCHVIEGHLRLGHCRLPEGASLPNLTQVTDFVTLEHVEGVRSLSVLLPRLSVVRGQRLLSGGGGGGGAFAFVLYGNRDLREIGPWSMKTIVRGSVFVEDNVLLCTDEGLQWNNLTSPQYRKTNFFHNNRQFCPFVGCEEEGYCEVRERSCVSTGLPCPLKQERKCHRECLGGCTVPSSPFGCIACTNFLLEGQCVPKCPETHIKYMNYRCITPASCNQNNWAILNPEDLKSPDETSPQGSGARDLECVRNCPEKFVETSSEYTQDSLVRTCKPRLECESTTLTDRNLGENLKYCTRIHGNLVIRVAGGKNVTRNLEKNLERVETITGYLKVVGANALFSLSFLRNLVNIEGRETIYDGQTQRGYSLYIVENPNLKELWDWHSKPSPTLQIGGGGVGGGSVFIHFNDKLCESEVRNFIDGTNLSAGDVSANFNGHKSLCDIFRTHLKAVPGSVPGTIQLSWMHTYCGVDERYVPGYHVFYRATQQNVSLYQGRDVCNDETVWCRDTKKLERSFEEWKCMNHSISGLVPNTRYAIYVESLAVNHKTKHSIISDIVYVVTYNINPGSPSKGNIEFKEKGMEVTWRAPSLPSFSFARDLTYELELSIEEDRIPDGLRFDQNCQQFNIKTVASNRNGPGNEVIYPPKEALQMFSCGCCATSMDQNLNPEDISHAIEIEDEDSRLTHFFIVGFRRKKRSIWTEKYNRTSACKQRRAPAFSCSDPFVRWTSSSLNYSLKILPSEWQQEEGNIYKKKYSTKENKLFVAFPKEIDFKSLPRNVTVKMRSCLGEMERCVPLNASGACGLCSNFYTWSNHSVYYGDSPTFEVTPSRNEEKRTKIETSNFECRRKRSNEHFQKPQLLSLAEIEKHTLRATSSNLTTDSGGEVARSGGAGMKIAWRVSSDLENVTLGYRIQYQRIDLEDQHTVQVCVPKAMADELRNSFMVPVTSEKHFLIGIEVKTLAGYSPLNPKCVQIPWNQENKVLLYLTWAAEGVAGVLVVGGLCYIIRRFRRICNQVKNNDRAQIYNPDYGGKLRNILEKYRLEFNQLTFSNRILGGGKYGIVFEGKKTDKDSGKEKPVAVKTILEDKQLQELKDLLQKQWERNDISQEDKSKLEGEIVKVRNLSEEERLKVIDKKIKELLQEAITMQSFDSFFVVKLVGVAEQVTGITAVIKPSLYVALEYMDRDLHTYLKSLKAKNEVLSEKQMIEIAVQVADGMTYLSKRRFVHRDLAARNCMIELRGSGSDSGNWEPDITIKIGDFGLTRYFRKYYIQKHDCYVPVPWTAPEAQKSRKSSPKSDIWSYGVLIFEIVNNGEVPRDLYKVDDVADIIPSGTSEFFSSVIGQCLQKIPRKRPTFLHFVRLMLPKTSKQFQEWFQTKSFFHSLLGRDSKSTEGSDEGISFNSLDASQDENNFTDSSTPGGTIQRNDVDDDDDDDDEHDEVPDDDNACLTPRKYGRDRSSCLSLNCVNNSLSCKRKSFSVSDDTLSFQ
nr:insulin-like receptor 1 [Ligia oceanica]